MSEIAQIFRGSAEAEARRRRLVLALKLLPAREPQPPPRMPEVKPGSPTGGGFDQLVNRFNDQWLGFLSRHIGQGPYIVTSAEVLGDQKAQVIAPTLRQAQAEAYVFQRPNPGIHFSPSAGARYAMQQGCLPHVMTGRPARDFFSTAASSRGQQVDGRYTVTTAVTLKEEANGACTIVASRGDPEGLRAEMLAVFTEIGAGNEVRSDTGQGSSESSGSFRQELHCLTLNGRPLFLVMSSSSERNRPRLIASLGPDTNGDCRNR